MKQEDKIELLSPAGSFDALRQAIHNGADAVYLGGTLYSARAYASNFKNDELKQAVDFAHLYGVKVYITVNTLVYETEVDEFKKYIEFLASISADALIMQDIGMAIWTINTFNIPVHSSTQMHNYSISNVEYLKEKRFDRAVLARETGIDDIKKASNIMDTEVFVHGALCISYSGQCLFSSFEHNRSGNRGQCAQACRMRYSLYANDKKLTDNKYILSPKDLALLENTDKIIEAGAKSIKLEGRMKSPEYVGFITKTYRKIIDGYYSGKPYYPSKNDLDTLQRLFNRGFTKGYAFGLDNKSLMSTVRPNHAGVHIGDVVSTTSEYITVKLNSPLHQGDGIKFDNADKGFICNKIYVDEKLQSSASANQIIQLENKINLNAKDKLLLTKDITLLNNLSNYPEKQIPIDMKAEFFITKPIKLRITDKDGNSAECIGPIAELSINAPLSKESVSASLSKLGGTCYAAENIDIKMDNNVFASKSIINKLRRDAVEMLDRKRRQTRKYIKSKYSPAFTAPLPFDFRISCLVSSNEQLNALLKHNIDRIYISDFDIYNEYKDKYENLYYNIGRLSKNEKIYNNEKLVICDTGGIKYTENNKVAGDYMLNITNSSSMAEMYASQLESICLSVEMDDDNIKETIRNYSKKYGNFPNSEILVYGRIQLMAMKHCILDSKISCGECKKNKIYLKDIKGNKFPVITDNNCNNFIYSKEPINKIKEIPYYKSIGINGVRLDFFDETPDEIDKIIRKTLCI